MHKAYTLRRLHHGKTNCYTHCSSRTEHIKLGKSSFNSKRPMKRKCSLDCCQDFWTSHYVPKTIIAKSAPFIRNRYVSYTALISLTKDSRTSNHPLNALNQVILASSRFSNSNTFNKNDTLWALSILFFCTIFNICKSFVKLLGSRRKEWDVPRFCRLFTSNSSVPYWGSVVY